jgi:hypothetical protein
MDQVASRATTNVSALQNNEADGRIHMADMIAGANAQGQYQDDSVVNIDEAIMLYAQSGITRENATKY